MNDPNASQCYVIRRGADKSLARPTSRCRKTVSIVSLERGVCSCAELQVFSVTEAKKKHVRRRARFQQHRDASCHQVLFPARRGAEGNLRHYDRNINLFLPGRAKDLSAPLYTSPQFTHCIITPPTPFPLYDKATHTMAYNFTETFTIFCLLSTTQHTN